LEHFSDASFLGKLLVLHANVRLDWKVIARYKHLAYSALLTAMQEKSFITLTPEVLSLVLQDVHPILFNLRLKIYKVLMHGDSQSRENQNGIKTNHTLAHWFNLFREVVNKFTSKERMTQ
jgi:hypothetical protein